MATNPTIFVIFGVTGDLMKKKIAPALLGLFKQGQLPEKIKIIGFARRPLGDDGFKNHVAEILSEKPKDFLDLLIYNQGQFAEPAGFSELKKQIETIEKDWGLCANKLFYLAVPPESFTDILNNLSAAELNVPCSDETGWARILIEKPFGQDEASAKALDQNLTSLFKEDQIYRLDHYLGKDGVLALKPITDPTEIKKIKTIEIKLLEAVGAEGRGKFYDSLGALRDVGQNHLLSIFSILTGRPADKLKVLSAERSQYDGYFGVEGVRPDSNTETYFKLETELDTPPWSGVKFIFESGKKQPETKKEVVIKYEDGTEKVLPLELSRHSQYVAEYERLLLDAIRGDQTHFLREADIEAAWRLIDPIVREWQKTKIN